MESANHKQPKCQVCSSAGDAFATMFCETELCVARVSEEFCVLYESSYRHQASSIDTKTKRRDEFKIHRKKLLVIATMQFNYFPSIFNFPRRARAE